MGYQKNYIDVLDSRMAYVEVGEGRPVVFLHGNPTSSFLWRDVMPHVEGRGRLIAPDLVGMGDSAKLEPSGPERYRFVEHRRYLDALLDGIGVTEDVVFVAHDWGSALAFDWANRNRDGVSGIAYMEAIVCPVTWDDWPEAARSVFQGFRSAAGESMVLDNNVFIERVLPGSIMRKLTVEEMDEYRRPFAESGESRRPTLIWPREIPIEGEPADVHEIVRSYAAWLPTSSDLPKLFVNAEPGAILTGKQRDFCRTWPKQTEVTVRGVHFIQEDSHAQIGRAVAEWLGSII